jgi:hypothetical protein
MKTEEMSIDHVNRLNSVSKLVKEGFEGEDKDMAENIFGYGVVWKEIPETNNILFVYRINNTFSVKGSRYDRCFIPMDTDVTEEWSWANFDDVASFVGLTKSIWLKRSLVYKVLGLLSYYGPTHVFGESYWGGFRIEDDSY